MKALIIINETFTEMALGRNTSLAYILSAIELGYEVFIYDLAKNNDIFTKENIEVEFFPKTDSDHIISEFKKINKQILQFIKDENFADLVKLEIVKTGINLPKKIITLKDIDLIIQRLEPMKAPFPPRGNADIDDVLQKLKNIFPKLKFNCPAGLRDKDLQEFEAIAIPTIEFEINQKVPGTFLKKFVIKPKNSAQSLGVFAIEIDENGLDFADLENAGEVQIYKVKPQNIDEIIKFLCQVQADKKNVAVDQLYNGKILLQPFLEGVRFGDIRVNILKNEKGDFYVAGKVFRKSLKSATGDSFTTGYITGSSTSYPVTFLTKDEQENLAKNCQEILTILNKKLRQKYENSLELGLDFILVGNKKDLMLSEINHHCVGLLTIAEAVERAIDDKAIYDGGLGLSKAAIDFICI